MGQLIINFRKSNEKKVKMESVLPLEKVIKKSSESENEFTDRGEFEKAKVIESQSSQKA